jgi:hypothetical protein
MLSAPYLYLIFRRDKMKRKILLFSFLLIMLFNVMTFATTGVAPTGKLPDNVTTSSKYIQFDSGGTTYVCTSVDPTNGYFYIDTSNQLRSSVNWSYYYWDTAGYYRQNAVGSSYNQCTDKTSMTNIKGTLSIYSDVNKTGFFTKVPVPPIVQAEVLTPVLGQIIALLPILIPVVIGFLGLRKGLVMLSEVLHRA